MAVDWAQAWQMGGIGFGLVFAVLVILAFVIWLTGLLLKKLDAGSSDTSGKDKGD
jgi:Na+-transporting methylmalonyl-CoA/oxaloacetate decarboxylase gamma subunit|tara:strand:- start:375 stop:539 length:165 start_codon:yes stop_codon:yes gene_type:complete